MHQEFNGVLSADSQTLTTTSAARAFWSGKRVLVTGGSQGLGRGLSRALLDLGAQVVAVARTESYLRALSEELPSIQTIQSDVGDKHSIYPLVGEAVARLGGIDVLINNASYLGETPLRLLMDTDCEDLELIYQVNVLAPFRLAKAVAPGMLLRGNGLIVNISSDAAIGAYPQWGGYSVSKAAVDHLSRVFDAELREHGVRTLCVDPGDMNTRMYRSALPGADYSSLSNPETVANDLATTLPLLLGEDRVRYSASEWREYVPRPGVEA